MYLFQKIIYHQIYYQPFWITALVIVLATLISYLYFAHKQQLAIIAEPLFALRLSSQTHKDEHVLSNIVSLLLNINYLIASTLFFFQVIKQNNSVCFEELNDTALFFLILGIALSSNVIKIISTKVVGFIFNQTQLAKECVYLQFSFNQAVGLLLTPIIIISNYSRILPIQFYIYLGFSIFLISFVVRVVKCSLSALYNHKATGFYIFLYFCAFEVFPLLIVWKFLQNAG